MRAKRAGSPVSHRLFQQLSAAAASRGYITLSRRATMMDNADGIGMDNAGGVGMDDLGGIGKPRL